MFRATVVEANRLNEMVWSMDVQIGKLNDGLKQAIRGEETVARIEQIVQETNSKVEAATKTRDEFAREAARMEKDGRALVDVMRSYIETLALEKKEIELYPESLPTYRTAIEPMVAEGKVIPLWHDALPRGGDFVRSPDADGIPAPTYPEFLKQQKGVREVHDLHIWPLSTSATALTAHLVQDGDAIDDHLTAAIAGELKHRFGIAHATLQFETGLAPCALEPDEVV